MTILLTRIEYDNLEAQAEIARLKAGASQFDPYANTPPSQVPTEALQARIGRLQDAISQTRQQSSALRSQQVLIERMKTLVTAIYAMPGEPKVHPAKAPTDMRGALTWQVRDLSISLFRSYQRIEMLEAKARPIQDELTLLEAYHRGDADEASKIARLRQRLEPLRSEQDSLLRSISVLIDQAWTPISRLGLLEPYSE